MKTAKVISAAVLIIALFVSVDLGFNFFYSLIPDYYDGIGCHSVLHSVFKIFGDHGWTAAGFCSAFEKSVWVTFVMAVENIVLDIVGRR
ncbi:MAG: hypothetical protein NC417_12875 [Candidatus Gastranaerophilales bacterium]|nr:hypothetical protein [Candidatus Gastranaerophilales bacterium]